MSKFNPGECLRTGDRRENVHTSQDGLICVQVSGLGGTIANGVGSRGNGGGDPVGKIE